MSHPDPNGPPDLRPIQIGEVWENPVTGERGTILELPWNNPDHRFVAELLALVGARVLGEHRHPTVVECFTVLDGELTVKRDGQTSILRESDWRGRARRVARLVERHRPDARVRVEATPGERWLLGLETLWGLARLSHTNAKGMRNLLQLAVFAPEFSDVATGASMSSSLRTWADPYRSWTIAFVLPPPWVHHAATSRSRARPERSCSRLRPHHHTPGESRTPTKRCRR